jgi:hypothetical protein
MFWFGSFRVRDFTPVLLELMRSDGVVVIAIDDGGVFLREHLALVRTVAVHPAQGFVCTSLLVGVEGRNVTKVTKPFLFNWRK